MEYTIGTMVFGNWKIVNLIGRGSYGKVYEIQREDFGLTYRAALKVISVPQDENEVDSLKHEGMTESETTEYFYSMVQDIVNEFALMFDLKGMTNVVGYEDHVVIKKEEGIGWDVLIRMELLTPLLDYASEEKFTIQEVTKLGIDLCKALELCNKYKIIHRDLKPENIFVSKNGDYKIGDFGIARTIEKTMSGLSKKGTYSYMAPEIYKGQSYGYTVDIYSLGIVLYRMLNQNRLPFMPDAPIPIKYSDREVALTRRMNGEEIKPPFHHDSKLTEIILKACAYESKNRYGSPTEMREALEAITFIDGNKQVINTIDEEIVPVAQEVEDENTASMLDEDENTVSMLVEEENTVSMLDEDENTVSMLEEVFVSAIDEESLITTLVDEDKTDKYTSDETKKSDISVNYKNLIIAGVIRIGFAAGALYYFITGQYWGYIIIKLVPVFNIILSMYIGSKMHFNRMKIGACCGILNIITALIISAIYDSTVSLGTIAFLIKGIFEGLIFVLIYMIVNWLGKCIKKQ